MLFCICLLKDDIEEVILMGGGTRIPKVQQAIKTATSRYERSFLCRFNFLLHDAMLAWYMLSSCVCLSVCHTPVLYQNGKT